MKTKPLGNNVLVELLREYEGISREDTEGEMQRGIVRDVSLSPFHLTASSAFMFESERWDSMLEDLQKYIGKVVRWEQYAEGGQTFQDDGKTYALIPWWRLIGIEE